MHKGNNLHFWYDASGKPVVVEFNSVKYGYLQNLQGDIAGIIDSLGNEVVQAQTQLLYRGQCAD